MDTDTHVTSSAFPAPDVEIQGWTSPWRRLLPLWRHAVWAVLFFGVLAASVSVRLEVQALQDDLGRNARLHREATVLHERLELERSVRRRTAAIESVADRMGMQADVPMVPVEAR